MFIDKSVTSPEQILFESQDEELAQELPFICFCIFSGLPIFLSQQDWYSRNNDEIK